VKTWEAFFLLVAMYCCASSTSLHAFTPIPYTHLDQKIPAFSFPDDQQRPFSSANLLGHWSILYFLPTRGAGNMSVLTMQDLYPWLEKNNIAIICVSDLPSDELAALRARYQLPPFALLSDYGGEKFYPFTGEAPSTTGTIFVTDEQAIVRKVIWEAASDHRSAIITFFLNQQQDLRATQGHSALTSNTQESQNAQPPSTPYDFMGKPALSFTLPDEQGAIHTLDEYQGTWHILCFFPNFINGHKAMKCLQEAAKWFKRQQVEIICITPETCDYIRELKKHLGLSFTFLYDPRQTLSRTYCLKTYETALMIIDEKGLVRRVMRESWAEDYLADFMLFFIKHELHTQVASTTTSEPDCAIPPIRDPQQVLFFPIDRSEGCLEHVMYAAEAYDWLRWHGIELICVSTLDAPVLDRIKKRLHLPFPILHDQSWLVGNCLGVYDWCGDTRMTIVFDKHGEEVSRLPGFTPAKHLLYVLLLAMNKN